MEKPRPVKELPLETARKIAAGEVIDRPAAIVRELIDNAIDAGANSVCVEIEDGGIGKIRITDNGFGMSKEDLTCCAKPHATSKITTTEDLLQLNTLGFRGEALGSIAAVSRLSITTIREGEIGYKMEAKSLNQHIITPVHWSKGTAVEAAALFENFPARRVFLKKPAVEAKQCKQTFLEKAMPWTNVAFRFFQDGKQKLDLPSNQTLAERFVSALELDEPDTMFHEIKGGNLENNGYAFSVVLGDCSVYRGTKTSIYIFVNGRRIWEYSLIQAFEYGSQGYFPNGTYPIAALYLTVDPALIDFNIHPAKREARFKDISGIHHDISSCVRSFYRNTSVARLVQETSSGTDSVLQDKIPQPQEYQVPLYDINTYKEHGNPAVFTKPMTYAEPHTAHFAPKLTPYTIHEKNYLNKPVFSIVQQDRETRALSSFSENYSSESIQNTDTFRYYGTVLGVFLLVNKNDTLYLIDQHAAHERILYNRFIEAVGAQQKLLFPYIIETESESDDAYLSQLIPEMDKTGFAMHNAGNGTWEITAIPVKWVGTEEDLADDLLRKRIKPDELLHKIAASCACRAAVKDGTILDTAAAAKLAKEAFDLPDPHCPHGRPVWIMITKQELFHMIRRTE